MGITLRLCPTDKIKMYSGEGLALT